MAKFDARRVASTGPIEVVIPAEIAFDIDALFEARNHLRARRTSRLLFRRRHQVEARTAVSSRNRPADQGSGPGGLALAHIAGARYRNHVVRRAGSFAHRCSRVRRLLRVRAAVSTLHGRRLPGDLHQLRDRGKPMLVDDVTCSVGTSARPSPGNVDALVRVAHAVSSPWVSTPPECGPAAGRIGWNRGSRISSPRRRQRQAFARWRATFACSGTRSAWTSRWRQASTTCSPARPRCPTGNYSRRWQRRRTACCYAICITSGAERAQWGTAAARGHGCPSSRARVRDPPRRWAGTRRLPP